MKYYWNIRSEWMMRTARLFSYDHEHYAKEHK